MAIPPSWIEDFVQQLSYCLFPLDVPAPLGCHYHFDNGNWEVALFPSMRRPERFERFGQTVPSPFSFDIRQAIPMFEEIQHLDWVAIPMTDENEVGPHLLIEGIVNDQTLLLRICAEVPRRFQHEPDLIVQEKS